jgi:hypothetical protein
VRQHFDKITPGNLQVFLLKRGENWLWVTAGSLGVGGGGGNLFHPGDFLGESSNGSLGGGWGEMLQE